MLILCKYVQDALKEGEKMMKKLLYIALSILLTFSLLPICFAMAAAPEEPTPEITEKQIADINEAVDGTSESPVSMITVSNVRPINVKKDARVFPANNNETGTNDLVMVYRLGSISFDFTVSYNNGDTKTFTYYYDGRFDGQPVMTDAVQQYYSPIDHTYTSYFSPDKNDQVQFSFMGVPFTVTLLIQDTDDAGNTFGYLEQNGAAYITDYFGCATSVSIPSEINGLTVVGVQSLNHSDGHNIEYIQQLTLPDSVRSISSKTFAGLFYCREINLGDGIQVLTAEMFSDCMELEKINVSMSNPNLSSIDGAVYDKAAAVLAVYPQGKAKNEAAYEVPDTVRDIDAYLSSDYADQVSVGDNNPYFTTQDGVLYNKDLTRVIRCGRDYSGAYRMPSSVSEIAEGAFARCNGLTSVDISDKVTEIVYYSFARTESLTNVTIPASVKTIGKEAFTGSSLPAVSLTAVETIGDDAFSGSDIQTVSVSGDLTSIGESAFASCRYLKSISLPNNLTSIGANAFTYSALTSVSLPDSLQTIGTETFMECRSLTEVSIGAGLTVIPERCFTCTPLEEIVIPNNIERIEDEAFYASSLQDGSTITIRNKDISIARCAFPSYLEISIGNRIWISGSSAYLSANGTQFVFPDSVTDIVYGELRSDSKVLENRTVAAIPSTVSHIGAHAFDGNNVTVNNREDAALADVKGDVNYLDDALLRVKTDCKEANLTVRKGTRIIADDAFEASSVTDVTLPEGLEIIGYASFYNSALERIVLPSTLKTINAFAFCKTSLKEILLPASVTEIGDFALASGSLQTIMVDPGNTAFTVVDGILYTKDMTELVYCPPSVTGELHIPSTVEVIRDGAFADNTSLTSVYLPRHVKVSTAAAFARTVSEISNITEGYPKSVVYNRFSSPVVYVVKGTDAEEAMKAGIYPFRYYEAPAELKIFKTDVVYRGEDGKLRILNDTTVKEVLGLSTGTHVLDTDGKPMAQAAKIGTGMQLTLEEGGKIVDSILIVVSGDVDGDNEVTSGDARLTLRASVQLEKYEAGSVQFLAADVDGNGAIESSDARTILRVSVKLETFA